MPKINDSIVCGKAPVWIWTAACFFVPAVTAKAKDRSIKAFQCGDTAGVGLHWETTSKNSGLDLLKKICSVFMQVWFPWKDLLSMCQETLELNNELLSTVTWCSASSGGANKETLLGKQLRKWSAAPSLLVCCAIKINSSSSSICSWSASTLPLTFMDW